MSVRSSFGPHLREWRQRRRLTQLDLALEAEISARHLSFIETGRAAPSREMVLRLAEQLAVPLRERNALLLAAGFAPVFPAHALDDAAMQPVRSAMSAVLAAHEPFPALMIDRHWTLIEANRGIGTLLAGVAPALLAPPVNVLRVALHPNGMAPRIVNLGEWRAHLLHRLAQQSAATADPVLADLLRELSGYPEPMGQRTEPASVPPLALPIRIATPGGVLSLLSTTMVFGTPADVTLSELAIETFLPADAATARILPELLRSQAGKATA